MPQLDAFDLKDFYGTPLGQIVRRLIVARLRARWTNLRGMSLFGLGFATPYLGAFKSEVTRLGALMPVEGGAVAWPENGKRASALVDELELPLPDASADRILLVHLLEWSGSTEQLLREVWRVLSPNGRVLVIVPNRRGLWARVDSTPFGHGRPYSRSQISKLLKEAMFSPEEWQYALYMPPFSWQILLRWPVVWERIGLLLWPTFSGLIMVEASKQIYGTIPARESRRFSRRIVPVPAGVAPRAISTAGTLPADRTDSA